MAYDELSADVQRENAHLKRMVEILRIERDHAHAKFDYSIKLLTGIHSLLYPAPLKMEDGRTLVFRPKDPSPHEVLQALSDRIRALPDEISKIEATRPKD